MLIWIIIWVIITLFTSLLIAMELINGFLGWRVIVIAILMFAIILIPIATIIEYREAKIFYDSFKYTEAKVAQCETFGQEYTLLGEAMNQNYYLHLYQDKLHRLGIFAPYQFLKELQPIHMNYFDMSKYNFWE